MAQLTRLDEIVFHLRHADRTFVYSGTSKCIAENKLKFVVKNDWFLVKIQWCGKRFNRYTFLVCYCLAAWFGGGLRESFITVDSSLIKSINRNYQIVRFNTQTRNALFQWLRHDRRANIFSFFGSHHWSLTAFEQQRSA